MPIVMLSSDSESDSLKAADILSSMANGGIENTTIKVST